MRTTHDINRFTIPVLLAGAIAVTPALAIGAEQKAPSPSVTPTPPAERNIGQKTDQGMHGPNGSEDQVTTGAKAPTPSVTPTPPAERNIGQNEGVDAGNQEAMRPDDEDGVTDVTPSPTPDVTPTPPAERNIEQEREKQ